MAENPWIEGLRLWLTANPGWAGLIIFLVAFTESIVVVGILIPGIMILFALGALIGLGLVDFYLAWATASLGAVLGDSFSYWLGYRYRDSLAGRWPFRRWPELIQQGRDLFQRRGVMGVVIGRFVGPLRPVVPVVAGMLGMHPQRFYPTAIGAGIAWSPAYLLPGVFLGASLDVASAYTLRLGVLLALIAAITWLVAVIVRAVYRYLTQRTPWLLKRSVSTLRRHPLLARYIGPLVIPARGDVLSIAMLGLVLATSLAILTGALLYAVIPGTPDLDAALRQGAEALRNHVADWPLLFTLFIGDWQVLTLSAAGLFAWLLSRGRTLAAWHWFAAITGAPALAVITQALLRQLPAWPQHLHEWGRFPDLPSVYTVAVLGFLPILVARDLRAYQRKWLYLAAALLIMMTLIARLYFQLAAFSGIINALLLTMIWCAIVGIGLRVRASAWNPARPPLLVYGILFGLGLTTLLIAHGSSRLQSLLPTPELRYASLQHWRNRAWEILPRSRSALPLASTDALGHEQLNVQWHGTLDAIRNTLERAGWRWQQQPPGAAEIIHIIHPRPDSSRLPLFLKDHRGRAATALAYKPLPTTMPEGSATNATTAEKTASNDANGITAPQRLAVIRFWDSGMRLPDSATLEDQPVWLGEAVAESVQVHGWWFTSWTPLPTTGALSPALLQLLDDVNRWHLETVGDAVWLIWRGPHDTLHDRQ